MNNIFVYIENEGGKAAEVCLELMTKGRELATTLGVKLEAVVLGENLAGISSMSSPNTAPTPSGSPTTRSSHLSARCPIRPSCAA